MVYWGTQKAGFHADEIFSYIQSDGDQFMRHKNKLFDGNWHTANEINEDLTVSKDSRFVFNKVYALNLQHTEHQPWYYLFLHAAVSFIPERFSVWPGIIVNILFNIGIIIVLYFFGGFFFKDMWMRLFLCFLWGISIAAIDLVTLTRMYTMSAFTSLLFTFAICKTVLKGFTIKNLLFVFLFAWFGIMSHLYFLIYAFILSALLCFYLMFMKQWKALAKFVVSMFAALLVALISNPTVIGDLGVSSRSKEAIDNFSNGGSYFSTLSGFNRVASTKLFAGIPLRIIVFAFVTLFVIAFAVFIISKNNKKRTLMTAIKSVISDNVFHVFALVALSTGFFILSLLRIAPIQRLAYYSFVIVNILFIVIFCFYLVCKLLRVKLVPIILLAVLFFTPFSFINAEKNTSHLYRDQLQINEAVLPYLDLPVVWINASSLWWFVYNDYQTLLPFKNKMFFASFEKGEELNTAIQSLGEEPFLMIVLRDTEFVEPIKQIFEERQYKFLSPGKGAYENIWVMQN
jgi:hypothetical protein